MWIYHAPLPVTAIAHSTLDLAILKLEQPQAIPCIPLVPQERQTVPESGSANAWGFTVDTDQCIRTPCDIIPYKERYEKVGFTPLMPQGYSGGPLLNAQQQCVGVVIAKSYTTECSYAEPAFLLHPWLQELGISLNQPALRSWQRNYLSVLIEAMKTLRSHSLLHCLGYDMPRYKTDLAAVYVPLHVDRPLHVNRPVQVNQSGLKHESVMVESHSAEAKPTTALEILANNTHIVLKGDPGCGKTTFSRYWALRLAQALVGPLVSGSNENKSEQEQNEYGEESLPTGLLNAFPVHIEWDKLYRKIPQDKLSEDHHDLSPAVISSALNQYFIDHYQGLLDSDKLKQLSEQGTLVLWFLDGLDEIKISQSLRQRLLQEVDGWIGQLGQGHRVCLTTRPYAYPQGVMHRVEEYHIQPLSETHRFTFIRRWFKALAHTDGYKHDSPHQHDRLKHTDQDLITLLQSDERQHLRELCSNPMLLTLTSTLYFHEGENALPKNRAGLYEKCINTVLKRWEEKHNYNQSFADKVRPQQVRQALSRLAFYAHVSLAENDSNSPRAQGDISKSLLEQYFFPEFAQESTPEEIEDYLYHKTGVLIDRGDGCYAFMHRTFREYLAARFIVHNTELPILNGLLDAFNADSGWWREVLSLAVQQYDKNHQSVAATQLLCQCLPFGNTELSTEPNKSTGLDSSDTAQYLSIADKVLACANAECERTQTSDSSDLSHQAWRTRLKNWLLYLMQKEDIAIADKAEAGRHLGWLGDPRPGTGLLTLPSVVLPDIQWVDIPEGNVVLEAINQAMKVRSPLKMAIYSVTYQQFQTFIDDPEGYHQATWWQGFEAELKQPVSATWQEPNHPRTNVNWFEATAFCRWLSDHYQQQKKMPISGGCIRLPDEWEWQQAATSADARRTYPWFGDYQQGFANINDTASLGRTTAVGLYTQGQSDQGVSDLAGNVWEWCANFYNLEEPTAKKRSQVRVLRGGAWGCSADFARAAYRSFSHPYYRSITVGFRVVCSPLSLSTDH